MDKPERLARLREVITENLRVQRGGADPVPYIDVSHALSDICARQNHTVFGRRGCGKTLLLQHSVRSLPPERKTVYLNCEDYKHHTFPNVLIEILDALFAELETHLTGWFGRKKRSRELIAHIRTEFNSLRTKADEQSLEIAESHASETQAVSQTGASLAIHGIGIALQDAQTDTTSSALHKRYSEHSSKISALNRSLPGLKRQIAEFFKLSPGVQSVYLLIDDYYHLARADQPFVMDYIHRLCKDLPLYFKVATLRHASTLYADRDGQPIGVQERHDFQPINVDFSLADYRQTRDQNKEILRAFGRLAEISAPEVDSLFKGEGFERLVMAGGGVPRDCLSLFLEMLQAVQSRDGRIGKDDVRILSRANFERRIEELKQDSEHSEQGTLIRGIYVLRRFCIEKQTNVMMVPEQLMQQDDGFRALVNRLLDYRIIHNAGVALTHKSAPGTYQAFAIDIGCYAHMRVLEGRFNEIDLADPAAKEKMRSAPVLSIDQFGSLWKAAPGDTEAALKAEDERATRSVSNAIDHNNG